VETCTKLIQSSFVQRLPPLERREDERLGAQRRSVHVPAALERAQAPLEVNDVNGGREIGVTAAAFGRVEPVADFFEDVGKHEILQIRASSPMRPSGFT
jgi:hypothetical protein